MMIPHISWVFVPASAALGDLGGLEPASMDGDSCNLGPADRFDIPGVQIPVSELQQRGIPELVAQPAAMIIGLSTHEQAILMPHDNGVWKLLLHSGKNTPESYTFRDRPEPRPVARRKQLVR